MLPEELRRECSILCSSASQQEAGDYYGVLDEDTLPKRINFLTSSYFVGVDIKDTYHLIIVSNIKKSFQTLSINKMIQIYGRCRLKNGVLSETIVYNSFVPQEAVMMFGADSPVSNTHEIGSIPNDVLLYKERIIHKASKVLEVYQATDNIAGDEQDLKDLFSIVKEAIKDKAAEAPFAGSPIAITRKNIHGKYVIAYLNIDFLVERYILTRVLYSSPETLKIELEKLGHNVTHNSIMREQSQEQMSIKEESKVELSFLLEQKIQALIIEIREKKETLTSVGFSKYLQWKIRNSRNKEKLFIERYQQLYRYIDADVLLAKLYEIKDKNIKAYKTLKNSVMFWTLSEEHPLKLSMREAFNLFQEYTPDEIHEKLTPIVKYHFHKTIPQRVSVSLFKAFYDTLRPRNTYIPIGENPLNFENRLAEIPKNENNLLKYFLL